MGKDAVAQIFLADHIQGIAQHMQAVCYRCQHLQICTVTARPVIQLLLDIFDVGTHRYRDRLQQIIIEYNHALTGRCITFTGDDLAFQPVGGFYCCNPAGLRVTLRDPVQQVLDQVIGKQIGKNFFTRVHQALYLPVQLAKQLLYFGGFIQDTIAKGLGYTGTNPPYPRNRLAQGTFL